MAYRKKRIHPAPNKNAAKVRRRELGDQTETSIQGLHPLIERLSLQLDFYDREGNLLDQRTQSYGPQDHITLEVPCLGACGDGRTDLEGKILDMVQKHQTNSEGRAKCSQPLYAGSADLCGHELRCRFEITYKPA